MKKIEQSPEYYDAMFDKGGHGGVYDLPYRHSAYWPLFRTVVRELRRLSTKAVLEVGCGTGALAHLLFERTDITYNGFDFSSVAVAKAERRTGRKSFFVGDAQSSASYRHAYDTIVCTEVLEHIRDDLAVVENWQPGTKCVCSVPNFDAASHERFFSRETDVRARYGRSIEVDRIYRVKKPALADISWRSYAQAIRWYRYRPRDLAAVMGLGSFESIGGWFLFIGRKR